MTAYPKNLNLLLLIKKDMPKEQCNYSIYEAGVPSQCSIDEARTAVREGKRILVRCLTWGKADETKADTRERQRLKMLKEISQPPQFRTYKELVQADQQVLDDFRSGYLLNPDVVLNWGEGASTGIMRPDTNFWINALRREITKNRKST